MKHLSLLFALLGCAIITQAQSIVLDNPPTTVYCFADEGVRDFHFDVENNSGNDIDALLYAPMVRHLQGSDNYFCWAACYFPSLRRSPEEEFITIPAGGLTDTFSGYFQPLNMIGTGVINYRFYDKDVPSDYDEVEITFVSLMPEIAGSSTICAGETLMLGLQKGVFDQYEWSTGSTMSTAEITGPGTYTVTVTLASDSLGDASRTAEFVVTQDAQLTPMVAGDLEYCEGASTDLSAGPGYDSYLWNDNSTSESITAQAGTYTVTVTKGTCSGEQTVTVVENPTPATPTISSEVVVEQFETYVKLVASEGDHFRWYLGDEMIYGEWENEIKPENKVPYEVRTVDDKGCTSELSQPFTPLNVGINEDLSDEAVQVFPNPANDQLIIQTSNAFQNGSISIQNALGATVQNVNISVPGQTTISVRELDAGVYFYTVFENGTSLQSGRLLIAH